MPDQRVLTQIKKTRESLAALRNRRNAKILADAPPPVITSSLQDATRLGLLRKPATSYGAVTATIPQRKPALDDLLGQRQPISPVSARITAPYQMPRAGSIRLPVGEASGVYRPAEERAIREKLGVAELPPETAQMETARLREEIAKQYESYFAKLSPETDARGNLIPQWQRELSGIGAAATLVGAGAQTVVAGWRALTNLALMRQVSRFAADRGAAVSHEQAQVFADTIRSNAQKAGRGWELDRRALRNFFKPTGRGNITPTEAGVREAETVTQRAVIRYAPALMPKFTPGGSAIPGQTRPLAEIMAGAEMKLAKKPITPEPWQMTFTKYLESKGEAGTRNSIVIDVRRGEQLSSINKALAEGKPVPPEVLKDYGITPVTAEVTRKYLTEKQAQAQYQRAVFQADKDFPKNVAKFGKEKANQIHSDYVQAQWDKIRAKLEPETTPAAPEVTIPDITRKGIPVGEGLDLTMARQLADGTFQVTPSYNQVSKGFERKIFQTQEEAKSYVNELQQGILTSKLEVGSTTELGIEQGKPFTDDFGHTWTMGKEAGTNQFKLDTVVQGQRVSIWARKESGWQANRADALSKMKQMETLPQAQPVTPAAPAVETQKAFELTATEIKVRKPLTKEEWKRLTSFEKGEAFRVRVMSPSKGQREIWETIPAAIREELGRAARTTKEMRALLEEAGTIPKAETVTTQPTQAIPETAPAVTAAFQAQRIVSGEAAQTWTEAGLQPSMLPEDVAAIEVRPPSKGKLTQISLDDQLKLEQYQRNAEAEGLKEFHATDPVAQYRFKMGNRNVGLDSLISIRERNFPAYFTVKQAQALRPHQDWSFYTQKGTKQFNHIPRVKVFDTIAQELGLDYPGGIDELANRVEQIRAERRRIAELSRPVTMDEIAAEEAEKPAVAEYYRKEAAKWREIALKATDEMTKAGEQKYVTAVQKAEAFERQAQELELPLPKAEAVAPVPAVPETGYLTPVFKGKETLAERQSAGLPRGKFYALDKPFESPAHDIANVQRVTTPQVQSVYDPDGLVGTRSPNLGQEFAGLVNQIKPADSRQAYTNFLQSKGYDSYVRGIDGDPQNRELIVFGKAEALPATGVTPAMKPTLREYVSQQDPTWHEADRPSQTLDRYRASYERLYGKEPAPAVTAKPQAQKIVAGEAGVPPAKTPPPTEPPVSAGGTTGGGLPPANPIGGGQPYQPYQPSVSPGTFAQNVIGLRTIEPGLTRQQVFANWIRQQITKVSTKMGGHEMVLENEKSNPALQERARVKPIINSQANILADKTQVEVQNTFEFDKKGRIPALSSVIPEIGAPTIQDVAARLPLYEQSLTPQQLETLTTLRDALQPYHDLMTEVGIELRKRGDVMNGGFYIPRSIAQPTGEDLPYKVRSGRGGTKKGFEKPAVFDSMAQGIDAGYEYPPIGEALLDYVRGAGQRATDAHIVNYFKALTDDTGQLLGETAKIRMLRQHPDVALPVENIKANLIKLKSNVGALTERQEAVIDLWANDPEFADTSELIISLQEGLATMRGGTPPQFRIELRALLQSNIDALKALKPDYDRAMRQSQVTPRDQGVIGLPLDLQGRTFPNEIANAANIILRKEGALSGSGHELSAGIQAFNAMWAMIHATGDLSASGIQGLLKLYDNPKQWSQAFALQIKAIFNEDVAGAYIADFDKQAIANGLPTMSEWAKAGGRYGGGGGFLESAGAPGNVPEALANLPVIKQANRAFSTFGDTLRPMIWQNELNAELAKGRNLEEITTSGDLGRIADGGNVMTGWTAKEAGGSIGRMVLFAPRWLQSRLEVVGKAGAGFRLGANKDQAMARNALLKLIVFGTLLTIAANEAQDKDTDFRLIVKGKRNSRFMRVKYGGRYYSLFGPWDSLVGTILNVGTGKPLEALRSMSSGSVAVGWDLITGKDYDFKDVGSRPVNPKLLAEWIFKSSIPFSAGQIPEGVSQIARGEPIAGSVAAGTAVLGVKSYPVTKTQELVSEWADDFKSYNAIPTKFKTSPLAEVVAERKQFPDTRERYLLKNPDVAAKLFITGQISSLRTIPQIDKAVELMKTNNLTMEDIPGLVVTPETAKYESATHKAMRLYFEKQFGMATPAKSAPSPATPPVIPRTTIPATPTTTPVPGSVEYFRQRRQELAGATK